MSESLTGYAPVGTLYPTGLRMKEARYRATNDLVRQLVERGLVTFRVEETKGTLRRAWKEFEVVAEVEVG